MRAQHSGIIKASLSRDWPPCFLRGFTYNGPRKYDAWNIVLFPTSVNKRPAPLLELADTFTDSNH